MKRLSSTILAVLLIWGAGSARTDVYNWIGPSGDNWTAPANWTGGGGLFPGAGDTAQIDPSLNLAINVNGAQSVGALDFTNGSGLATGGTVLLNSGSLTIGSPASVGSGQTLSGGGTINVPSINLTGGTLAGTLSIIGNVNSTGGTISPGTSGVAGTINVTGNVALDHGSVLNYKLGPGGYANDYISITGNLSLDGTLNVNKLAGFASGTYTLIDYTGALTQPSGGLAFGTMPSALQYSIDTSTVYQVNLGVYRFGDIPGDTNHDGYYDSLDIDAIYRHLTVLPPGFTGWSGVGGDQPWPWVKSAYQYQYDVNYDGVVSQDDVTYELWLFLTGYGDANLDRATDFQDFQALLDHWQQSGDGIGWAEAEFNGDGVVDFLDFQILVDYWNPNGWNFVSTETPEPATLSLLTLGGLALLRRRKLHT